MFSSIILERGYGYYSYGHVESVEKIKHGYRAVVSGSEDYLVHIYFDDEEVTGIDCTCPYADSGRTCKHMAAVLYAIDEQDEAEDDFQERARKASAYDNNQKLEEIIANMSIDEVQKELLHILEEDGDLRARFLLEYSRSQESITQYISKLQQAANMILRQHSDRYGFVDWKNAGRFKNRLIGEVILPLRDFVQDEEEAKIAFDVSLNVFDLFHQVDIDDSGGETQHFTEECIELWEEIIDGKEDSDLARYMLEKLIPKCDEIGLGEYMSVMINDFILEHFEGSSFIPTRLEAIDKRIDELKHAEDWNGEFNLARCIKERMELMEELEVDKEEILLFRNQYRYLSLIRDLEIQELEAAGKTEELVKLLRECMEMDKHLPGLIARYSKKLADCYKQENDLEKYKAELLDYITVYSYGDRDVFLELKQCVEQDQWIKQREEIFSELLRRRVDIKPLLALEGLKERLFSALKERMEEKEGFEKIKINEIRKYEPALRPEYDGELLNIYEELIRKISEFAGGRSHYRELVEFVRRMYDYPGGRERAKMLLDYWRRRYENRPAMQEELRVLHLEVWK